MWDLIVAIVIIIIAINYYFGQTTKKLNLPPGPISFPLIGSVLQVAWADHQIPARALQKLAKKYGPIMSVQLGSVSAVAVTGFDAIKNMQTNPDFMDRFDNKWLLDRTYGLPYGLILSQGELWSESRRITHALLKNFGFGKQGTLESLVMEELREFSNDIRTEISKGNNVFSLNFYTIFLNVVWILMTGTRFQHDDPELLRVLGLVLNFAESAQIGGGIVGLFPKIVDYAPNWSGYKKHYEVQMEFRAFFEEVIASYQKQGTYKTAPANFVECFLQLIDQHGPVKNPMSSPYSVENLVGIMQDISLGGSDTQGNLMNFGIRYLIQCPNVQKKLQEEVDRVVGNNRQVNLADKPQLKYTQAVVFELLRISNILAVIPRQTYKDCKLEGFDIPKGTLIMPIYWSANMDEDVWDKPYEFNPERFLNQNGDLVNTEKILSFGIGKRDCVGKSIAISSLLLTLATLVQQFSFEPDPTTGVPPSFNSEKLTRNTMPFKVLIKIRQ